MSIQRYSPHHLAEVALLKAMLREYRKTGMAHRYCLIRPAGLVYSTAIDDRCPLCKRTDAEIGDDPATKINGPCSVCGDSDGQGYCPVHNPEVKP